MTHARRLLERVRDEIEQMTSPAQLRLAARLLDHAAEAVDEVAKLSLCRLAHSIVDRTSTELGAALAMQRSVKP